jgi:hypothetical protein
MDSKTVNSICSQIYRRFPEVNGVHPKVQPQSTSGQVGSTYLLIFKGTATTADGKTLPRIVRATVDEQGKILKVTTSR